MSVGILKPLKIVCSRSFGGDMSGNLKHALDFFVFAKQRAQFWAKRKDLKGLELSFPQSLGLAPQQRLIHIKTTRTPKLTARPEKRLMVGRKMIPKLGPLPYFFQGQSHGSFRVGKHDQSYPSCHTLEVPLRTGPLVRPLIQRVAGHEKRRSGVKVHNRGL